MYMIIDNDKKIYMRGKKYKGRLEGDPIYIALWEQKQEIQGVKLCRYIEENEPIHDFDYVIYVIDATKKKNPCVVLHENLENIKIADKIIAGYRRTIRNMSYQN